MVCLQRRVVGSKMAAVYPCDVHRCFGDVLSNLWHLVMGHFDGMRCTALDAETQLLVRVSAKISMFGQFSARFVVWNS
jgi:hypothetical protein